MLIKDRVAFVTGGGKGIGRAIALELAKNGAKVVITYLNSRKEADEAVGEIKVLTDDIFSIRVDVRSFDEVNTAVKKTMEKFGRLDILVNNAAFMKPSSFVDLKEEDIDNILNTNVKGVINCTKAVLPFMKEQKGGKIINIASIAGVSYSIANSVYGSSKAAVINLTRALSREFGKDNITINSVSPGPVRTDMLKDVDENVIQRVISETPLGKLASSEDIAKAVLFFASSDSDIITGQNLVIDGGRI